MAWVAAPLGAGKTLGVAGWCAAQAGSSIWYEVSEEDRDPGAFVARLGLGLSEHALLTDQPRLGQVPPSERRQESKRVFELLLGRVRVPFQLILDDFHEADGEPAFLDASAGLFEAWARYAPPGSRLVVVGRRSPPQVMARLVVEGTIEALDSSILSLDVAEVGALIALLSPPGTNRLRHSANEVLSWSGGWAVAAALCARRKDSAADPLPLATGQAMKDYLSSELLDRLPTAVRRDLERLSPFPRVSERQVAALDCGATLAELARYAAELAIPHTIEDDGSLHLHDLVRETLRASLLLQNEPTLIPALVRTLAEDGQVNEAGEVAARFHLEDELVGLVYRHAGALLATGRHASLGGVLRRIPETRVAADPQLLFWSSTCLMQIAPEAALSGLRSAFDAFEASGQSVLATLAAANLVQIVMVIGDNFRDAHKWIQYLERESPVELPLAVYARARATVASFYSACVDEMHRAQSEADAALYLVEKDIPHSDAMTICAAAMLIYQFTGRSSDARAALRMARSLSKYADYDLWAKGALLYSEVTHSLMLGDSAVYALNLATEATSATYPCRPDGSAPDGYGPTIPFWAASIACTGLMAACALGDIPGARRMLDVLERDVGANVSRFARGRYLFTRGLFRFAVGDSEAALEDVSAASEWAEQCGCGYGHQAGRSAEILILVALRRFADARRAIAAFQTLAGVANSRYFNVDVLLGEAFLVLEESGLVAARPFLATALAQAHAIDRFPAGVFPRTVWTRIVGAALELGVEPEFARKMATWANLTPPRSDCGPNWPWPIQIRALGSFSIDGASAKGDSTKSESQQKLIKLLVAADGEPLGIDQIARDMWAGRDAAASRSAFDTALHRLRRSLGDDSLVLLEGGAVRLDRMRVWVDAWAFQELAQESRSNPADLSLQEVERLSTNLLNLYRGTFSDSAPQAILLRTTARLARLFSSCVEDLVNRLRRHGAIERAFALVEAAIDRAETDETLHHLLVNLWFERGFAGEAQAAYDRFRTILWSKQRTEPVRSLSDLAEKWVAPLVS